MLACTNRARAFRADPGPAFQNFESIMNKSLPSLVAIVAALASPLALAHGDGQHAPAPRADRHAHSAGHAAQPTSNTAFGRAGDPAKVTRAIRVDMSDDMRFSPAVITVQRGETVRLDVVNKGQVLHELVLGTADELRAHAEAMRKSPGMEHDAPQMVHVKPGRQGEVVWQFTEAGEFDFACLLPGHFEAGMVGKVVVR